MTTLARLLLRNGFRKGLMGGSRPWLVVGGAAATVRVLQRLSEHKTDVVFCEELLPGQSLVVADLGRRSKR